MAVKTAKGAPLILIGQPNLESESLDNPILVPKLLSFLTYHRFAADVKGLDAFPRSDWPDNIPLVYYAYLYHGRARDGLCRRHARGRNRAGGGAAWREPLAFVDAPALRPLSLYRHDGRLDHRRGGAPALARLLPLPDGARRLPGGQRGKRPLYLFGVPRALSFPGTPLRLPDREADRRGTAGPIGIGDGDPLVRFPGLPGGRLRHPRRV
ncbi:protein of unknown function [Methylacidimicrobium sp. AP8]|nr:protein of unknown function [Methylacidimicrobium sp. AP8]